jgi:hypothetical protein
VACCSLGTFGPNRPGKNIASNGLTVENAFHAPNPGTWNQPGSTQRHVRSTKSRSHHSQSPRMAEPSVQIQIM